MVPFFSAVLFLSLTLASCGNPFKIPEYPRAVNGVLDLTAWDPAVTGSVPLMGEWKFIWNQDRPEFAGPGYPDAGWRTLTVPGYWNGISGTGKGYGWYRLRIKIHRERFAAGDRRLGISASLIQSAYEMYVNGNKVMSSGVFGRTGAESIPQLRPRVEQIDIPPIGDELVIAVRNSNFHHRSGGPYSIPEFGLYSELRRKEFHSDLIRLTVLGIIMMMGIYHMMLWLGRREDMASLYFFFGCLVVFLRLLATSGYLERIFPGLPMYELRFKIVYSSMPFVWMSFAYFFRELFREEFSG
ncbi:MAG: hypothetical protein KBA61_19770, partial [Spirochaetes bacterium]|nr:hypothetical protein [Spirochaetota bacterium]